MNFVVSILNGFSCTNDFGFSCHCVLVWHLILSVLVTFGVEGCLLGHIYLYLPVAVVRSFQDKFWFIYTSIMTYIHM